MIPEIKLLFKQRVVWLIIVLSSLITYLSLQNGWQNIAHIRNEIQHAQHDEHVRKQTQMKTSTLHGDAGEIGYYVFHNVYHHPTEWSFIALGNRVVTPYVQRIRLLGLQGQLYDGESHHPEYVMLGSFDYAFWLIFFAPLICIAFMHDLKASEHQSQRLVFLQSLLISPSKFWYKRVLVRCSIVSISLCFPLIIFSLLHGLSLLPLLTVLCVTISYILFWTLVCSVVSLRTSALNSSFNAMVLASLWIIICLVLPNFAQAWIHTQYPVQEGSAIALQHRQLVHSAWDLPKEDILKPFYKLYPQWQDSSPVEGRFHWKWYYAFQHMADVQLNPYVEVREQALLNRNIASNNMAIMLPSLGVQKELEEVAESNISHLIRYRNQVSKFHTELRHYIYPYLFNEVPFHEEDFKNMPLFRYSK